MFGLVTVDETVKFLVGLLHLIVIVTGSALRLPMFDEYGFPAHYPLSLFGAPPSDPGVSGEIQIFCAQSTISACFVQDCTQLSHAVLFSDLVDQELIVQTKSISSLYLLQSVNSQHHKK